MGHLDTCLATLGLGLIAAVASAQDQETRRAGALPTRTLTVTARVLDARGQPLAGAGLIGGFREDLLVTDALEQPLARSAEDGRLRVRVTLPRVSDYSSWPTLLIAAKGRVAIVIGHHPVLGAERDDADVDLGELVLFGGMTVRGQVVDGAGRPLAGARVSATDGVRSQYDGSPGGATPQALSAVLTDQQGLFALPCVSDGSLDVTFAKSGYYERRLFSVGRETPLRTELHESGFVAGRAVDAKGGGIAATLAIIYECGGSGTARCAADGRFRASIAQPGRYRLRNHPQLQSGVPTLLSAVLEGPQEGIELRPSFRGGAAVSVVVRAVDAESGKELAGFRAAGFWDDRTDDSPGHYLLHGGACLQDCDADRRVRLVPQQRSGHVLAVATGHAPALVEVDLDDGETRKEITLTLGPEALIQGRVVDEAGNGIAGATVWAIGVQPNTFMTYDNIPSGAVQSDAGGGFRIGSLWKGTFAVQALHADRPVPAAVPAQAAPGKAGNGVRIRMPQGLVLRGKLTGGRLDPRCQVRLEDPDSLRGHMGAGSARFVRRTPAPGRRGIAADGTFSFAGLDEKDYRLLLVHPTPGRFTQRLEFTLDEGVRARAEVQEFDVTECVPGRIEGTVDLGATGIPSDRLIVVVTPCAAKGGPDMFAALRMAAIAPIDLNRRFVLEVVPGVHELRIVDTGSCVVVHEQGEPFTVKSGPNPVMSLALQATRVHVKLVPAAERSPIRVASLRVKPVQTQGALQLQLLLQMLITGLVLSRQDGILVEPDQTELDLWLPEGDFTFAAWNRAGYLASGNSFRETELVRETVSVSGKGKLDVKLTVAPPPATADIGK